MTNIENKTFLNAAMGLQTPYTPLWLMRQAGRYLAEYRAVRDKAGSFMGLATSPDMACEVTLQPIDRFGLDAAILFSDILTVPDAMGLGLDFAQGEGPKFARPLQTESAIAALQVPDMAKLDYVFKAVSQIKKELNNRVPLIGFSGSPFTLACYMVEGAGSKEYAIIKKMMYQSPELLEKILQINADSIALYLNEQIKAGAQAVMIFDSWGGVLADREFEKFSLSFTARTLAQLERLNEKNEYIPRIVFTKGGGLWLSKMANLDCDALGVDWTVNLSNARALLELQFQKQLENKDLISHWHKKSLIKPKAIQGNLDPAVLMSNPQTVRAQAQNVLNDFGKPSALDNACTQIFNLGHGIGQFTPPENVSHLVDEVHSYSKKIRN